MISPGVLITSDSTTQKTHGSLTLPETNSEFTPENRPRAPIGKDRIPTIHFWGRKMLVSGRVTIPGTSPPALLVAMAFVPPAGGFPKKNPIPRPGSP